MQELWQPIEGSDGYEVSNLGRVRHVRYLKTSFNSAGYKVVGLGAGKQRYVHRLVAQAFIPNPDQLPEVNHIDSNRGNPEVENLEWCTSQRNKLHSIQQGNRKTKLSPAQVLDIRKRLSEGESLTKVAEAFDLQDTQVLKIRNRTNYDWVA